MKTLVKVICFLLLLCNFTPVVAEEDVFTVNDNSQIIETFSSYGRAYTFYRNHLDEYKNLAILHNDEVIVCEYGLIELPKRTIEYYDKNNNQYTINGNYVSDLIYVDSDYENVSFLLAGVKYHTKKDDLKIITIDNYLDQASCYKVDNDNLYHCIKTDLNSKYYSFVIDLGEKPNELLNNQKYYSYDNHFFYTSYLEMIDDYKNNSFEHAVNKTPYYNYYNYLPFRSTSNYSLADYNFYLNEVLGINDKLDSYDDFNDDGANDFVNKSQLYGELEAFKTSEEVFGTNSLLLLAMSMYESSFGKSLSSYLSNNLFKDAAFTTDFERENQVYESLNKSVYAYSKYYLSDRYFSMMKHDYVGSHIGSKTSGINQRYSDDPYFGEKVASIAYKLDYENKDYNHYCLGIIEKDRLNFYADNQLSQNIMTTYNAKDYPLIILEAGENYYKVQLDNTNNPENIYDFENDVAYIKKDDVKYLINEDKIVTNKYLKVTFDFDGGSVSNLTKVTFKLKEGEALCMDEPIKEGYKFVGFDKDLNEVSNASSYKAQYKKIEEVTIYKQIPKLIELNKHIDLSGGKILVEYEDGTSDNLKITSEMSKGLKTDVDYDGPVDVEYCGITTQMPIKVSSGSKLLRNDVMTRIEENIASFKENNSFSSTDIDYIKDSLDKLSLDLSFNQIRYLDLICLNKNEGYPKFIIKDQDKGMSFSGLAFAFDDISKNRLLQLYDDTYFVLVNDVSRQNKMKLDEFVEGYGFIVEDYLNIKFNLNLKKVELNGPLIAQIKLENKDNNRIYSVYHLTSSGDIVKCKTTWSNEYVQFIMKESGDYVVLSSDSGNCYDIMDMQENLSPTNNAKNSLGIEMEILMVTAFLLFGFINVCMYFILESEKKKQWNDYRRLLRRAVIVQEEELKN